MIGGGPAGSVAAAALARAGRDVLLLERERFPRFHIGESLLPGSLPILDAIGVRDKLDREDFPDKRGATFIVEDESARFRVAFEDALGDRGRTWHAPRARLDEILLRHAEECGVEVHEGATVKVVAPEGDAVHVRWTDSEGAEHETAAAEIVDASGRRGVIAKHLGLRRPNPILRKVAVHDHFDNAVAIPDAAPGDLVVVSRRDLGWIWVIPLPGGRTSVGAVFDRADHQSGAEPAGVLRDFIRGTPLLAERLAGWEPSARTRFESDFSYDATTYHGERFLLVGDAAAFVDPVFSSGVHLAVSSAWEAAHAILTGGLGARREYEDGARRRIRRFVRFAQGFYHRPFRDLLFAPGGAPKVALAITGLLAGVPPETLGDRFRIGLFHTLTRINRFLPLVPRVHRRVEVAE
ncbi:MAG: NAD(P)/FAD-dependent oxidoreductase [Planctomycetota bacterium]